MHLGLFAIIKEDFVFSLTFGLLTEVGLVAIFALFYFAFRRTLDILFATVLISNLVAGLMTILFSVMVFFADKHLEQKITPENAPEVNKM